MSATYNSREVTGMWGGIDLTQEPGDDTFIEIVHDEDAWTKKVGVKGKATRSATNNKGATIKVTAMYTSPTNKLLSAAHAADMAAGNGSGIAPLTVTDRLGNGELHFAPKAWIKRTPDFAWAKEVGVITWEFDCESIEDMYAGR